MQFAKWIENKRQDPSVPTVTQEHLDKKSLCDLPDSVLAEGLFDLYFLLDRGQ